MGSGDRLKNVAVQSINTNRAKHVMFKNIIIALRTELIFYKTQYFKARACFKKTPIANI